MTNPRTLVFIAALGLAVSCVAAWSQPARELWVQRYDDPHNGDDYGARVAANSAGDVIVTGVANKSLIYTAKYAAADGSRVWERLHSGEIVNDMSLDNAGNVIVALGGHGENYIAVNYIAKYAAADGSLLWDHRYRHPAGSSYETKMALDYTGNVILSGTELSNDHYEIAVTAKYAGSSGALIWSRRGPQNSVPFDVAVDRMNNVLVTGSNEDVYTAKYAAANGALLWEHSYDGHHGNLYDSGSGIAVDSAGNAIVTGSLGYQNGPYQYYTNLYTAKYGADDGVLLWQKSTHYRYPIDVGGFGVAVDRTDNVIVLDTSPSMRKYAAADGAQLWRKHHLAGTEYYQPVGVATDASSNVVITSTLIARTSVKYHTAKYAAANGTLLWEMSYGGKESYAYSSSASSMAVGSGFVVVTGESNAFADPYTRDIVTVKYVDGPTPQTIRADGVSVSKTTLNGILNPNGFTTNAAFEFGTDPMLATATSTTPIDIGQGTAAVRVNATLHSLAPLTTYYYRAVGTGNNNTNRGAILSSTTPTSLRPRPANRR